MSRKFSGIQYLRAAAAVAVICHHALHGVTRTFLSAGVDVFFVISGFIMYSVARNERPGSFLRKRIIRIVPLYWAATLMLFAVSVGLHPERVGVPILRELGLSLFFVPHYSLAAPTMVWPLLWLGWTLNYEMFFYAMFAVGLATRRLLPVMSGGLIALVVVGLFVHSTNAIWITYTDPLLLEFLAGVYLAKFRDQLGQWAIPLLPLGIIGFALFGFSDGPRALVWGVPAFLMVAGTLALERSGKLPTIAWLEHWGDASYSIYLFQGYGLALAIATHVQNPALVVLKIAAGIAVGLIAHRFIEAPALRQFSRAPKAVAV